MHNASDDSRVHGSNRTITMTESIEKQEEICEYCAGSGYVAISSPVYGGESIMGPIGMQKCICQKDDSEEVE